MMELIGAGRQADRQTGRQTDRHTHTPHTEGFGRTRPSRGRRRDCHFLASGYYSLPPVCVRVYSAAAAVAADAAASAIGQREHLRAALQIALSEREQEAAAAAARERRHWPFFATYLCVRRRSADTASKGEAMAIVRPVLAALFSMEWASRAELRPLAHGTSATGIRADGFVRPFGCATTFVPSYSPDASLAARFKRAAHNKCARVPLAPSHRSCSFVRSLARKKEREGSFASLAFLSRLLLSVCLRLTIQTHAQA